MSDSTLTHFSDKVLIVIGALIISIGIWRLIVTGTGDGLFFACMIGGPFLIAGIWKTFRSSKRRLSNFEASPEWIAYELASGSSKSYVIKELTAHGMDPAEAKHAVRIVSEALKSSPQWRSQQTRRYIIYMVVGALACLGGLALTLFSFYESTKGAGNSYAVFWGSVLFGALAFMWGFIGWLKHR